jgi:hypothetical protein
MRFLLRFRLTRAALLVLADHGLFRQRVEETIKRDVLSKQNLAEVVPLVPPGLPEDAERAELGLRSSAL